MVWSSPKWRYSCFKDENSSSGCNVAEIAGDALPEEHPPNVKRNWLSNINTVADTIFSAEPWTVPWTTRTILQVMLLWITSFWLVGSWIIPLLAHISGLRKETLTYRGQAFYSLLTDVAEGIAGIAILHRCLAPFRPLSSDWFKFSIKGKWQLDVGLGCLMFPLVNRLSQVNLNLLPMLPPAPVTVSSVKQSIFARDPVAMALYAVVVSVCAPIWEEVVFRGFLLPSLTRYMPVWCLILVSSLAFALAHFSTQRMLALVFLGIVMGTVFARSRNLLPSMLLHSLWNAFVFIDLMK
ncbi:CAAX amino terminal protease [Tanacetum coccineum]